MFSERKKNWFSKFWNGSMQPSLSVPQACSVLHLNSLWWTS